MSLIMGVNYADEDKAAKLRKLAEELNLRMDVDFVDYSSKIEIAAGILQSDLSKKKDSGPSLVHRSKKVRLEIEFPFSPILNKHFKASWASATERIKIYYALRIKTISPRLYRGSSVVKGLGLTFCLSLSGIR